MYTGRSTVPTNKELKLTAEDADQENLPTDSADDTTMKRKLTDVYDSESECCDNPDCLKKLVKKLPKDGSWNIMLLF